MINVDKHDTKVEDYPPATTRLSFIRTFEITFLQESKSDKHEPGSQQINLEQIDNQTMVTSDEINDAFSTLRNMSNKNNEQMAQVKKEIDWEVFETKPIDIKDGDYYVIIVTICDYSSTDLTTALEHLQELHNIETGAFAKRKTGFNEKLYNCKVCDFSSTQPILLKHVEAKHLGKINGFKCTGCEYTSSKQYCVKIHKRSMHDKVKDHICDQCGFASASKQGVVRHVRMIHDKIKGFLCSLCDYAAMCKDGLSKHMKMHQAKRKFPCERCSYAAIREKDRVQHDKHDCHYQTIWKKGLMYHIERFHANVKDFMCTRGCNYASATKGSLDRHIKMVHEIIRATNLDNTHSIQFQPNSTKQIFDISIRALYTGKANITISDVSVIPPANTTTILEPTRLSIATSMNTTSVTTKSSIAYDVIHGIADSGFQAVGQNCKEITTLKLSEGLMENVSSQESSDDDAQKCAYVTYAKFETSLTQDLGRHAFHHNSDANDNP